MLWSRQKSGDELPAKVRHVVDEFAELLRAHAAEPPVVYYGEWIDMWSMGDVLPSLGDDRVVVIDGLHYQACCHRPPIRFKITTIGDEPSQELQWLLNRLREAEDAWDELAPNYVILLLRKVTGGLVEDREIEEAQSMMPDWLAKIVQTPE
ncbi:MAG TPA: hypothetical protein VGI40_08695 [Pirellulaceae bacterium]